jgi:hypothetical protein
MCLSNSHDDRTHSSMSMCLSESHDYDIMSMCLSDSKDDDSMSICLSNSQHDRNHIACRCVCRTHTIMIACRWVCQTHKMMTIMPMCLLHSQDDWNHSRLSLLLACLYVVCRTVTRNQNKMIACRCVCRTHTMMIACRCVCQTHKMMTIMPMCLFHSQDDWNHSRRCCRLVTTISMPICCLWYGEQNCAIPHPLLNEGTCMREYSTIRPIRHISFTSF